jgi:hypothetical protein
LAARRRARRIEAAPIRQVKQIAPRPLSVTTGLDPVVHAEVQLAKLRR